MPNWCNNFVEISGSKEQLDRVEKAFTEGRLCDEFIPIPAELRDTTAPSREDEATRAALIEKYGSADWYDFCVNNWGTKWDVGGDVDYGGVGRDSPEYLTISFDSAWAPPCGLYEALEAEGMSVRAYYYESGMCFAGVFENGYDDCYDMSGMSSEEVADTIPEALDEMFAISEEMANYEEHEREEE